MIADFNKDLDYSHKQSDQPFWRVIYQQAFPDMVSMVDVRTDGWAQRGGIDRIIITMSGRVWKIDEKARRNVYNDILLEFISNDKTQAPGWVAKDLACDFIAYAQVPAKRCYLLPVVPLQRAWHKHGESWRQKYGQIAAENVNYKTWNCPVPITELMHKIAQAMYFTWNTPTK